MTQFQVVSLPGVAAALLLIAATPDQPIPAMGDHLAADGLEGPVKAHVERVLDGDTIEVTATVWLGQTISVRVRVADIDAPELEAHCAEERMKARAARDFLVRRVAGADIRLSWIVHDKYGGRERAAVADARGDVGQALLAAGLARAYRGDRRLSWCETR